MKFIKFKYAVLFASLLALTACGNKEETATDTETKTSQMKQAAEQTTEQNAEPQKPQPKTPTNLDEYIPLQGMTDREIDVLEELMNIIKETKNEVERVQNSNFDELLLGRIAERVFLVHHRHLDSFKKDYNRALNEQQSKVLQFYSEENYKRLKAYYDEQDPFKKQELAAELLPEVKEWIKPVEPALKTKRNLVSSSSHKAHRSEVLSFCQAIYPDFQYREEFAKPECDGFDGATDANLVINSSYDMNKKAFEYMGFHSLHLKDFEGREGVVVEDEALARKMSAAQSNETLSVKGFSYHNIDIRNKTSLSTCYVKATYYDIETGEEYLTREFYSPSVAC